MDLRPAVIRLLQADVVFDSRWRGNCCSLSGASRESCGVNTNRGLMSDFARRLLSLG